MAEFLFNARYGQSGIHASSAGISACPGESMSTGSKTVLLECGINPAHHHSRPLTVKILQNADLVIALSESHLRFIEALLPTARNKLFLLNAFSADSDADGIPDPFGGSLAIYRATRTVISDAVLGLGRWLGLED